MLGDSKMKLGIFTKEIHVEKIVNYLNNNYPSIDYIISTERSETIAYDFDIGISYCFPYIVKIKDKIWYNYHPAPLPEYPGLTNYAIPIKDKVDNFGVTLHIMTDEVDKGPILRVKRFNLDSVPVSTNELGCISHYYLFQLFKETVKILLKQPKSKEELDEYLSNCSTC